MPDLRHVVNSGVTDGGEVVAPLLNAFVRRQNGRAMERLKAQLEGAKAAA